TKLSHAKIPDPLMARLDAVKKDDEKVKTVGVDILSELVEQVKEIKSRTPAPNGFHFYTLNLEKAVSFILERTHLIPLSTPPEEEVVVDELLQVPKIQVNGSSPETSAAAAFGRRQSSVGSDPRNRVIVSGRALSHPEYEATPFEASVPSEPVNTRATTLA